MDKQYQGEELSLEVADKCLKLGLLGLGTVGSGVAQLLLTNQDRIARRAGVGIEVKWALVRDAGKDRPVEYEVPLTTNINDILNDPEIELVVEVMGGQETAFTYIMDALNRGKNVVTANKDLLSTRGQELFATAEKNGVDLYFEASVGGGIPIIRPLKTCLAGNRVEKLCGIVNGTTNYILTQMEQGTSYEAALKLAQEQGFAEADPSADVLGLDAARKIAILASIGFGARVRADEVSCVGIQHLEPQDLVYARELGYKVKLLALAEQTELGLQVRVHPSLVPLNHALASIDGVLNAIVVHGNAVGEVVFVGQGAGRMPTASAVVGDIIEVARNIQGGVKGRNGCTCFDHKQLCPPDQIKDSYFVRFEVEDKPGVMAKMAAAFGAADVSLWSVIQKRQTERGAEIVIVTYPTPGQRFQQAIATLKLYPEIFTIHQPIIVEGDEAYVAGHH
ncbi:MAG: homoserine dehydrogenase [Firmicutes bacterium]|nr:homoserine dehydrogenase [Bacillota bacterium]